MSAERTSLMSTRLTVALVLLSALTFVGFFALSAYAPDLRSEDQGGADVFSKSAVGFAGLYTLLQEMDDPVSVSRNPQPSPRHGLLILTPDLTSAADKVRDLASTGPCLIVLPKWMVAAHPLHPGWVDRIDPLPPSFVENVLKSLSRTSKIAQAGHRTALALHAVNPRFANGWNNVALDSAQTLKGADWSADIADKDGHILLGHRKGTDIYVLSDPDLLNTQGLSDKSVARGAVTLIERLRGQGSVAFDVTLNGFGRSPSLLRAAFAPPFLGATLCAILAALLIGFHAATRFGAPERPEAIYAFGKAMLVDNSAGLIRVLGRESAMAPRYAQAMRAIVARHLGGTRELSAATLHNVERRTNSTSAYAELSGEAERVRGPQALIRIANRLYQWRMGITHERV